MIFPAFRDRADVQAGGILAIGGTEAGLGAGYGE